MDDTDAGSNYELNACRPNREQTWLLHAAVSSGDRAVQAWMDWRDHIDLDTVDPASFRLLPMAYRNLVSLGQEDHLLQRLKGIYRHTWYKNQMICRQAQDLLTGFDEVGLHPMLLKGAALTERFYHDNGARFMNDIDLMVPAAEFEQAAAIMMTQGWQPDLYSSDAMLWYYRHRFKHGCALKQHNIEVDLHSQLLRFLPQDDEALWKTSLEGQWRGCKVYFLNDTDQLFHTCVHGLRWSHAYLSWIPDALTVVRNKQPEICWDTLVEKSQQTRTIPYLWNGLAYLADEFQAPIPKEILTALHELPVSWVEKQEYKTMGEVQTNRVLYQARRVFVQSCRYRSNKFPEQRPIALSLTAWIRFLFIHAHPPGLMGRVRQFLGGLAGKLGGRRLLTGTRTSTNTSEKT